LQIEIFSQGFFQIQSSLTYSAGVAYRAKTNFTESQHPAGPSKRRVQACVYAISIAALPPKLGAAAPVLPFSRLRSEGPLPVSLSSSMLVGQLCVESHRSIVTASVLLTEKISNFLGGFGCCLSDHGVEVSYTFVL